MIREGERGGWTGAVGRLNWIRSEGLIERERGRCGGFGTLRYWSDVSVAGLN